ncbi:MAG: tyrosine-protein phosphatase [Clostridia bacterium]|nr:tyrosine-protein phosphatase [Clostridia bacterium]
METQVNKPLPLDGPKNVRELGGYGTEDGGRTKEHVFLRSDGLDMLTGADRRFLRQYPVKLVVDLRSQAEEHFRPDRLDRHFERLHVPMFDHVQSEMARRMAGQPDDGPRVPIPHSLADIYVMLAQTEQEEIRTVLRKLIDTDEPALFHCTAGKDRTGIISMFLLETAGVPEETIIADYAATSKYLAEGYGFAEDGSGDIPKDAYLSTPDIMMHLRDYLRSEYGSVLDYLRSIGITDEDMEKLRRKFVEPA